MSASVPLIVMDSPAVEGVERDMLRTMEPLGPTGQLWIAGLVVVMLIGVYAFALQATYGLSVTAMGDYVSWGVYISNFVFFIGISHAGTLISAILRVTHAEWRRPITRMAEAITCIALAVGASMVVVDMGRPDRILQVFYRGRLQSPILWDVAAISTYLTGSILYLYVAMIPDLALLARSTRMQRRSPFLTRIYRALSLGFQGTPEQSRRLNRALAVMAVIIIPVAISVHTVVSWIFGMTVRPGWHSTIFGPYFVVGAIYSGTAAIILAMAVFRKAYHLEKYLTPQHFRHLGLLLFALTALYGYFTVSEYLTVWYGGTALDARLVSLLMGWTPYGITFWLWVILGLVLPGILVALPTRRTLAPMVIATILINIGMWVKRYLIVVPTMETPEFAASGLNVTISYVPTVVEWAITAGALATFLLLFTLFSRVIPILSIWETAEDFEPPPPLPTTPEPEPRSGARWATVAAAVVLPVTALAGLVGARPLLGATPAELASPNVAVAVQAQAAAPAVLSDPMVEITVEDEDGEIWLIALVTDGESPVTGARVEFRVGRTFGEMALGEDVTLSDGTAGVPFPHGLRGGPEGELEIVAEVTGPARYAGTRGGRVVLGGEPLVITPGDWPPRTLWSSKAPPAILLAIGIVLLGVWGTYAFVVVQLAMIPGAPDTVRRARPGLRQHPRRRR